jgi:hypothetical protein
MVNKTSISKCLLEMGKKPYVDFKELNCEEADCIFMAAVFYNTGWYYL